MTKNSLHLKALSLVRKKNSLFRDINQTIPAGHLLLITGPNGVGKSSLLRIIAGLSEPSSGAIIWQDQVIKLNHVSFLRQIHYLGHANGVKPGLTVKEYLTLLHHLHCYPIDHRAMHLLLEELNLIDQASCLIGELSAGQKRKLALIKLPLIPKPLWILDEPFTTLDINATNWLMLSVKTHLTKGGIAIISSHQAITMNPDISIMKLELC